MIGGKEGEGCYNLSIGLKKNPSNLESSCPLHTNRAPKVPVFVRLGPFHLILQEEGLEDMNGVV